METRNISKHRRALGMPVDHDGYEILSDGSMRPSSAVSLSKMN